MWYFVADEHYNHAKILDYCGRPFADVTEMNEAMIANHNAVVASQDITIHAGDFGWFKTAEEASTIIRRLHGSHIFLKGSHDRWLPNSAPFMWRKMIDGQFVVVCHYAMRTWERAHHGSFNVHGHSHGMLPPLGKQLDVGVDCHGFAPVSFETIKHLMKTRPMLHGVSHDQPLEMDVYG